MRGQAARLLATALKATARIALVLACLAIVGAAGLAFRLTRSPLPVTTLARRFLSHPAGMQLRFAAASLFWNRHAAGAPLVLALNQPVLSGSAGPAARAATFSAAMAPGPLLLGRLRLLSLSAAHGAATLVHTAQRTTLAGQPATRRSSVTATLQTLHLQDIALTITGPRFSAPVQATIVGLAATRIATPTPGFTASLSIAQPGQAAAAITASLAGGVLTGTATNLHPAHLPLPTLFAAPFFATANVPLGAGFRLRLGQDLQPQSGSLNLSIGPGTLAGIAVTGGAAHLDLPDPAHAALPALTLRLATGTLLTAHATASLADGAATATLALEADTLDFATLARAWPAALAPDARAWITGNITEGTAHNATASLTAHWSAAGLTVTDPQARLEADHLTVHWLRPAPPLTQATATLTLENADALRITVPHAIEAPSTPDAAPLTVSAATLRIAGLRHHTQTMTIDATIAGPVAQHLALLRNPRLHLLASHPMDFGAPSGTATSRLHLALPLENHLTIAQITVAVTSTATQLHLGGVIGGKDLDDGTLSLAATTAGLTVGGTATLAGLPSTVSIGMDFRPGPPTQAVATYTASGTATLAALRAAGIPLPGAAQGGLAYAATVREHRNGAGEADIHLDLGSTALSLGALGWSKQAAQDALADAHVTLDHDRLVAVDRLSITGPEMRVEAHAAYAAGQPVALSLDRLELGRTRAAGTVRFATQADTALHVDLSGPVLDLTAANRPDPARMVPSRTQANEATERRRATAAKRGRPWDASLRFATVVLGPHSQLSGVDATAANDGLVLTWAKISGNAGQGSFHLAIAPGHAGRTLTASATDAGGLLQSLALTGSLAGGTLAVTGTYDDRAPDHPLAGTATIERFRVNGAPAVARLLQGMTLYGLVDVLKGPGLGITHLVAPFQLVNQVLTLRDARAFSGSLGFTAKGDIDLAAARADLTGTIVPAYFFNTLLGKLPVLGKLFSAEAGGGLFAATYSLTGSLAEPDVHINPLAALAPGVLRDLFKLPQPAASPPSLAPLPAPAHAAAKPLAESTP